jgi:nucleotide-binding universal stress UspA family protein
MKGFKKILFPVDLSEVSPKIVPWVREMAEKFNGEIHLLFVARNLEHFVSVYVAHVSIQTFQEALIRGAEEKLEEFAREHFRSHPRCTPRVLLGDIAEEILNYAESENMDLIIMGTHGRKGLERVYFGSIAERVIKMSPTPVLSINPYRVKA